MDLSQITDGQHELPLAGQTFRVRLLTLREWGRLQAWLKTAVRSPVAEAIAGLEELADAGRPASAETRKAVLDHAQEAARLWPPRVGSMPWIEALNAIEGGTAQFLAQALRAAGHAISDDAADELERKADVSEIADLIRVCLHGELPAPKARKAPTEAGPAMDTPSSPTTGESCFSTSSSRPDGPTPISAT